VAFGHARIVFLDIFDKILYTFTTMIQKKIYVYGRHALTEALLHAPASIQKIFIASTMDDPKLRSLIHKSGILTAPLTAAVTPRDITDDTSHQGVIGVVSSEGLVQSYDSFIEKLEISNDTSLVLLNGLHDPHNVGAIIRSAAAFGVAGVLMPEHNQAPITGAVIKVSAGMAFRVPLVQIGNVNHIIEDLKKRGFWVYGLAGEGAKKLGEETFTAPSLFVLGNESKGLREKTREHCDILLSIPMNPQCESLNVAASTAVALYAWSSQHGGALDSKTAK
jgi:23S rRNA (guanosine2251-2'-O)-methyltransferase